MALLRLLEDGEGRFLDGGDLAIDVRLGEAEVEAGEADESAGVGDEVGVVAGEFRRGRIGFAPFRQGRAGGWRDRPRVERYR